MPNWVDNCLTIVGETEKVKAVIAVLTQDNEFLQREREYYKEDTKREFSFSNLVCPPKEIWDEYFMPSGFSPDPEKMKLYNNTETGWYEWNNAHWGTKWDVDDVEIDVEVGTIRFNTAWSCVSDELLKALAELLSSYGLESCGYWYEEEQGWGGEMNWYADLGRNYFHHTDEWDIPNSHADYAERGKDCICDYSDDTFEDCPTREETE